MSAQDLPDQIAFTKQIELVLFPAFLQVRMTMHTTTLFIDILFGDAPSLF
jgi:hypothetical protein